MFKILKNRKGVTLVELLAVVVILGIIAAIAVPTIGGLIERQEERAAEATYDTIVEAAKLYAEDATPFTLATLESEDFVDLKDNVFGLNSGTTVATNLIWVVVSGGNVTFYEDSDVDDSNPLAIVLNGGAVADDIFVNGFDVTA
ncbi:MAG: hypothetical protein A2Y45_05530 [Tenericutes bacterium GWC2_34_14]|nr:MAG: hypothetical protein A2Z84_08030 [Tenericutes bacterium GWA2_35_7]OHE28415.1 MAG: hypothetical protein A2Y45_05530 [Tenericutes bacterium GWC2_34_14]OHE33677.1 MAG: hypothetical protein A2012_04280 [Tenericutes bacterium GWE2_34_108]OHE36962.1 MAG: hypothetical protein A2Y46_10080 [Tenericutes bacterium GWF1_35_14]OHE37958.1 MAG: hypothetical protein A2Y44_08585 [Tenericutes bacterium GWF2_35_184]OHE41135.1 MAG: hypothetical protein A3K26_01590 [Tenericutes bacterium RIFOXYA12_FULL_35_